MTRLLCVVGLVCIGSALGAFYVAQPKTPDVIFCEQRVIDLGDLRQMQIAEGTFTLGQRHAQAGQNPASHRDLFL